MSMTRDAVTAAFCADEGTTDMMTITSPAGRRLARAKAEVDRLKGTRPRISTVGQTIEYDTWLRLETNARTEFREAASAVAAELMEQRFHLCEVND